MEATYPPIHLAGSTLERSRHVCAFFHARDEEYRVLLPYITEGFEHGDKAFHIVDPAHTPEHLRRLQQAGIDTAAARERGQLEIRSWYETYLRGGRFDQQAMLALIAEVLTAGKAQGFPITRLVANMEWALEDRPGVGDIIEYEARLNYLLPNFDDAVVWTYDLAKFGANVVIDILRTHPLAIIGSVLQVNPFYMPPDIFLQELKTRQSAANAR